MKKKYKKKIKKIIQKINYGFHYITKLFEFIEFCINLGILERTKPMEQRSDIGSVLEQ